jgi:hypothetical protein
MPNKPVKVYIVQADHIGIIFIATSKKNAFEYLQTTDKFKLKYVHSYWSFAQLTKGRDHTEFECESGKLEFLRLPVNRPILGPSLFT